MIKRKALLLLVLLAYGGRSVAQNVKGNIGPDDKHNPNNVMGQSSPDIVGVDLFTGVGSVNIPIHSYNLDGLNFNVSIHYDTRGIKVDQLASPIGLGWDLNAGATITREVNGIEDEVTLPAVFNNGDNFQGHIVNGATLGYGWAVANEDDIEKDLFHLDLLGRGLDFTLTRDASTNEILCHTYPNSEIKVELKTKDWTSTLSDGTPVYSNVRNGVQANCGINQTDNIVYFIITDEQGNKFYFDRGTYKHKTFKLPNYSFSPATGTYYPAENWVLTKLETYNGNVVTYEYAHKYVEYIETVNETFYPEAVAYDVTNTYVVNDPFKIEDNYWKGEKFHIKKINYPDGTKVLFDLRSSQQNASLHARCDCKGDYRLLSISIENETVNSVKNSITYVLQQGYFNTPKYNLTTREFSTIVANCSSYSNQILPYSSTVTNGVPLGKDIDSARARHLERGMRLKLLGIQRKGTDNASYEQYYTFSYENPSIPNNNDVSLLVNALPYRFSAHKDFYGYYNGQGCAPHIRTHLLAGNGTIPSNAQETIETSIPYHQELHEINGGLYPYSSQTHWGTDRTHNSRYTQAFLLNKITNACNGVIELRYDDYTLSNPTGQYGNVQETNGGNNVIGYSIDADLEGQTVNDGVVVKSISYIDGFNSSNSTVKYFTYNDGIRFNRGGYTNYLVDGKHVYTNYFISPLQFLKGSNHGFSNVITEEYAGVVPSLPVSLSLSTGFNRISKQSSWFTNLMYVENNVTKSSMYKPTGANHRTNPGSFEKWRMGLIFKNEEYDAGDFLTSKTELEYETKFTALNNVSWYKTNYKEYSIYRFNYVVLDCKYPRLINTKNTSYIKDPSTSPATVKSMMTQSDIQYDDFDNIKFTKTTDSKGDNFTLVKYYNYDYYPLYTSAPALIEMHNDKVQYELSTELWKKIGMNDSVLLSYNLTTPKYSSSSTPKIVFPVKYITTIKQPLTIAQVFPTSGVSTFIPRSNVVYNTSSSYGSALLRIAETKSYNSVGFPKESRLNDREDYTSSIYDVNRRELLATVENAKFDEVAFTSFESMYSSYGSADENKGNWDFDPSFVTKASSISLPTYPVTGYHIYDLNGGGRLVNSKPLSANKYILSFWANYSSGTPNVVVTNGGSSSSVTLTQINAVGDWKLYTAKITANINDKVELKGSTSGGSRAYIDELRLHPANASMTSYAYLPLFGVGSVTSSSNYITYYQYDVMGRKIQVKDIHGNVLKKIESLCDNTNSVNYGGDDLPAYHGPKIGRPQIGVPTE